MNDADFLSRSAVYIREGELEKAQIVLRRILTNNPNHPHALELSGDLALKKGRIDEAIHRYEQACDNYTKNDQHDRAIICLEKVVREDDKNQEMYWRLADSYTALGMENQAIERLLELCTRAQEDKTHDVFIAGLRKIVDLQSQNLPLHLSFVMVLRALDQTREADAELSKLKAQAEQMHDEGMLEEINKLLPQPDGGEELDPKSRIELGNLLYEIGSRDEAVIEFEKAVSDLIDSGEIDEAVNVLNRIMEIDPDNQEAITKRDELLGEGKEEPQEEPVTEEPQEEELAEEKAELAEAVEDIIAEMPEEQVADKTEEPPAQQPAEGLIEPGLEPSTQEGIDEQPEGEPEPPPEQAEPEPTEEYEDVYEKTPDAEEPTETMATEALEGTEAAHEPVEHGTEEHAPEDEGLKLFDDLSNEIEGFIPVSEMSTPGEEAPESGEAPQLEGQIADIEFLLKQTEEVPQTFEITDQFDEFKNNITWSEEDALKKTDLAKRAFDAGLHETALHLTAQAKEQRNTWPLSIELSGKALIRLGRYSEAVRTIAPSLIAEEIPEESKLELRYLLASAYEGLGDFENAMREIERIMSIDQDYRDVKELYALMGGKEPHVEQPPPEIKEKPAIVEGIPPSPPEPVPAPEEVTEAEQEAPSPDIPLDVKTYDEEEYPTIVQEEPSAPKEKEKEKPEESAVEEEEEEEERGENITFL